MTITPHGSSKTVTLHHGDCLDILAELPDNSVDAVVTDPPYGLEFMGKTWDKFTEDSKARAGMSATGYTDGAERLERPSHMGGLNPKCRSCGHWQRGGNPCSCDAPDFPNERRARSAAFGDWCELWTAECLRVLKPGGHLLAFGGTRTWHRLACAVEDAGFEVRDSIAWMYGSGFPKSLDVSKAIDKAAGAEREVTGYRKNLNRTAKRADAGAFHASEGGMFREDRDTFADTAPATDDARKWAGFGTALKPAFEPIVVARKPLAAGTVAGNVLAYGTGALNVDGCRVGLHPSEDEAKLSARSGGSPGFRPDGYVGGALPGGLPPGWDASKGRWPANVVLDETQATALDQMSGESVSGRPSATGRYGEHADTGGNAVLGRGLSSATPNQPPHGDAGGASRFFYVAKADASERVRVDGVAHPTVKPLALMRWLVRLVTPPGGTVLEPFAGSGTTVEACILEGFRCIAIEREADYLPLIVQRVNRRRDPVAAVLAADPDDGGLFDLLDGEGA